MYGIGDDRSTMCLCLIEKRDASYCLPFYHESGLVPILDTIPNINVEWEKFCFEKFKYHIVSFKIRNKNTGTRYDTKYR